MNTLSNLTLIPASAGSGKTHRIKEQLVDWVESDIVKPDRIVAVTFTETAASELRERIRTTLMARGRLDDALRLEQSYILTIHGFGRRLLVEYAFEIGNSPIPRLMEEGEDQLLLRKVIAQMKNVETIGRKLNSFGYRYDFGNKIGEIDQFRQHILKIIQMVRTIGNTIDRNKDNYCTNYITQTYGHSDNANILNTSLRSKVNLLISQYPNCMRDFVNSETAKYEVENDFRNLKRAIQTNDLYEDWYLWKSLQKLKVFKKNKQLPLNYQQMARDIIESATELHCHPGPLKDACLHYEIMLQSALEALNKYAEIKRDKGIIDYTDMIDCAYKLLEQPAVLAHIANRFDCLVIDEFQDTNPLQFSLLWKMYKTGVPTLIVGDLKQSIMGFQSADPRLMRSLLSQYKQQCIPLEGNWRSQSKLLDIINAISEQLFGKEYKPLKSMLPYKSRLHPLEIISFEGKGINNKIRAKHVAARVKTLLYDNNKYVYDESLNQHRRLRGKDIAILGMTNKRLTHYADALRKLNISVWMEEDGWFERREIQLAYYGLSFVADTQDRYAALYLAVTELGEENLTSALGILLKGNELVMPLLTNLKTIAEHQLDLSVDEIVTNTLDAMNLFDLTATWPKADQARANLLKLIAEARTFATSDCEAFAVGGYYGSGLKTFLAWISNKVQGKDNNRQPPTKAYDEDAVQLLTWHSAKGKEWPVVIVTTFDRDVRGQLPNIDIHYTDFSDLDLILKNAKVLFSPAFVATETNDKFMSMLNEKAYTEGLNLLYVSLTRAREMLILEWQNNLHNSKKYTYWHLLRDTASVKFNTNNIYIAKKMFPCLVIKVDRESPIEFAEPILDSVKNLSLKGRRALKQCVLSKNSDMVFTTPSTLHGQFDGEVGEVPFNTTIYSDPLTLNMPPGRNRGLIIHRSLELLLGHGLSPVKTRKALHFNLRNKDWVLIQKMARSFMKQLKFLFGPTRLFWEVPITSTNIYDSTVSGIIDLLVETPKGYWILDHKSDEDQILEKNFNYYLPQLMCYAQSLSDSMGLKVQGIAIHWACLGSISATIDNFEKILEVVYKN